MWNCLRYINIIIIIIIIIIISDRWRLCIYDTINPSGGFICSLSTMEVVQLTDFMRSLRTNLVMVNCRPLAGLIRNINLHKYASTYSCKIAQGKVIRRPTRTLTVLTSRRGCIQFLARYDTSEFLADLESYVTHYVAELRRFDESTESHDLYSSEIVNVQATVTLHHEGLHLFLTTDERLLKSTAGNFDLRIDLVHPEVHSSWNIAHNDSCIRINRHKHTITARSFENVKSILAKLEAFLDNLVSLHLGSTEVVDTLSPS